MKVGLVLRELHRNESTLATELLHVSERHKADHDIYYLAHDLAGWSRRHVREIAGISHRYGVALADEPAGEAATAERPREGGSELGDRGVGEEAALLVLRDLRTIYVEACGVNADWEMLAQVAQGAKDTELLGVASRCRPDTLRQMSWANAKLKETSPQILISS